MLLSTQSGAAILGKHLREDYLQDWKKHLIETQKRRIGVSEATLPHVNMSLETSVICSLNEKHSEKAACTRAAAEQFFILPLFGLSEGNGHLPQGSADILPKLHTGIVTLL